MTCSFILYFIYYVFGGCIIIAKDFSGLAFTLVGLYVQTTGKYQKAIEKI